MNPRDPFIKPGLINFPVIDDIHDVVPFPIVTYADPAVDCEDATNTCRPVRDVTQSPPTFPNNPTCFALPNQVEVAVFIAAMKATVGWNLISCKENGDSSITTKVAGNPTTIKYGGSFAPALAHPARSVVVLLAPKKPTKAGK